MTSTIRSELAAIGGIVAGITGAGGGDNDRLAAAVERLADCLCRETTISAGGVGVGCLPFVTNEGNPVAFPVAMPLTGDVWSPASRAEYIRVAFPTGQWQLSVKINRLSSEYYPIALTAYTSANGFSVQSLTDDTITYQIDINGGGWLNLATDGAGVGFIESATFCQRPPVAPADGSIVIANGELGRVLNTETAPKAGRPFFGPADWQPDQRVTFLDVANAVATDIQNIAEKLADQLDPTDDFVMVFREIGQFGQVIQSAQWEATWADVTSRDTIGVTFSAPFAFGSRLQISVDGQGGLNITARQLLAGVRLSMKMEP